MIPKSKSQAELVKIADTYEKAFFEHHPELGMYWGRQDIPQDRFMDHAYSGILAWQAQEDTFLKALNELPEGEFRNTPEHLTYLLLKQTLENNQAIRLCQDPLWDVNPLWGWHNRLSMVALKQPVGTIEERKEAFSRWNTFDTVVEDELNNLAIGIDKGYLAPKPAVIRVLNQLEILLKGEAKDSPFFDFAQKSQDEDFKKQILLLIAQKINPSIQRYMDFLRNEYLPIARDSIGLSNMPCGLDGYKAKIVKETTLSIDPKAIYDFGLSHMESLKKEIAAIGEKLFCLTQISAIFLAAKSKPEYRFHSEDEILNYNLQALDRALLKISDWFKVLPHAKGTVQPYPLHRAQTGASGEYHPPTDDGSRPGIFYINTYNPQSRCKIDQEATLFHELIPGHHLQVALAHEDKTHHTLDKYLWNCGYGEGWALYSERLADEMQLYQDDIARLGMLSNEALRTARLVIDPGIHVMNWTREQAYQYLKDHTALDENIVQAEIDRYIMAPGQATSYMLGKREIDNLRTLAQEKLGNNFDIREFHHQVLKNGAVTLPILATQIKEWLEILDNK